MTGWRHDDRGEYTLDEAGRKVRLITFDEYERLVRLEWPHVPDAQFAEARARVLHGFLARPSIYYTAYARERWEVQARENLSRSIAALQGGA